MITLTDTAAEKVKGLIEAEGEPELALRVAVRPGGCSGFSYEMFFDSDVATDDITGDFAGVRVVVDPSSAHCSTAPRSTTRTGCSRPGSPSTTPTHSAPAAAARASRSRPGSGGSAAGPSTVARSSPSGSSGSTMSTSAPAGSVPSIASSASSASHCSGSISTIGRSIVAHASLQSRAACNRSRAAAAR